MNEDRKTSPGDFSVGPERIWLAAADADGECAVWFDPDEGGTMYLRSDIKLNDDSDEYQAKFAVGYRDGYADGVLDGNKRPKPSEEQLAALAEEIASLKLHPVTDPEYDAGYIAARNDASAIIQEAADSFEKIDNIEQVRSLLEWIEDYALADADLGEIARRAGEAQRLLSRTNSLKHHEFVPNKKFPWFCETCGYAPHEPLMHGHTPPKSSPEPRSFDAWWEQTP